MELDQAATAARVEKEAGLRHVVRSALEDTRPHFTHLGVEPPTLLDVYKVPHFDARPRRTGSSPRSAFFRAGPRYIGRTVSPAGAFATGAELAEWLAEHGHEIPLG